MALSDLREQELYAMLGEHIIHDRGEPTCTCQRCVAVTMELDVRNMKKVGKVVQAEGLSLDTFRRAVDLVFRDFGPFGHHSERCVYLKDDRGITRWCCADDCEIAARSDMMR